ncbi:unnamed protein product [Adineta steineri]|uniref:non-specific serine/threonine protein kinase n=1 Tax=Adineta steineri TaxID=433720 RepID=A0A814FQW6_9BILA|nr:unnamed protein product [Adineta steineri]CAF1013013.1 unnamed protein product [Adineta steineri]CAF1054130.1 unnamed protein product [Adineta steineri]CAF3597797.1 unnamed protein product [Adineta steineri]CAF3686047.1 unnamed protein product [Adineta steineri]
MAEGGDIHQESRAKWPISADDYELGEIIGRGATALVQAATVKKTKERVAVKRINLDRCNTSLEELLKEIQVMSQCQNENVVRFNTSFVVGEELWLIMKLLDGGSLLDVIRYTMQRGNCRNGVLDEVAIATVLREVIKGLDYFHSNGHIHRDIKAGNILLGTDGSVQIADFGVSAFIASGGDITRDKQRHTFVGTPCWMAPEVMEQQPTGYDTKADIWSFGILAIELATGTAPYHKYPPMKVLIMTLQNEPPTLEICAEDRDQYKQYSKTFSKMIEQCLQKNPADRPTAKQLLKHDFFKKAKDRSYIAKHLALKFQDRKKMEEKTINRRKPTSVRAVRLSDSGEWKFSSGSDDEGASGNEATTTSGDDAANKLKNLENQTVKNMGDLIEKNDSAIKSTTHSNESTSQASVSDVTTGIKELSTDNNQVLKFTLRIRNTQGDLHDIKFEFNKVTETVPDVVSEMVLAHLIDERDAHSVTSTMTQLVENPSLTTATFALASYVDPTQPADDKLLIGFAQLSLNT